MVPPAHRQAVWKKSADLGAEADTRTAAQFDACTRDEASRYAGVVKAAGLAP